MLTRAPDELTPAEALPFERLAAIVTDDTELWSIAEQGPLGPEAELDELINEYGERLRELD